jgi:para-nitrobenzyl esterase
VQGPVSEDCLYLNVWTPARRQALLPVLLWIHGGAFLQGSGSVPVFDGSALASRGVVVVTVNYRLGVLGFLAHPALTREAHGAPPGNYGLQDLIAALRWLHRNAAAFGGDPSAITIDGQSAGAGAVLDLVASPLAAGLFARAVAESGGPAAGLSLSQAERAGEAFARSRGAASLADLRALTPEQLSAGVQAPTQQFSPIVDGVLLPRSPDIAPIAGPLNDTPILVGGVADEDSWSPTFGAASPAALKTLLSQYGSMAPVFAKLYPSSTAAERASAALQIPRDMALASLYAWARKRLAQSRRPLYGYLFDHIEPGTQSARYRVFHSSETPYLFGTLSAAPERKFTARDRRISRELSSYWVSFIETGDPNTPDLPYWPPMRLPDPQLMELGDAMRPQPLLPARKLHAVQAFLAKRAEHK